MFRRRRPRCHFLRSLAFLAAFSALLGGICYYLAKRRREQVELDRFLMDTPVGSGDEQDLVREDLEKFVHHGDNRQINLTFTFDDAAQAKAFMDDIARSGCSSLLDENNGLVDVFLSGVMNEEEFDQVISSIVAAVDRNRGKYQGYVIED